MSFHPDPVSGGYTVNTAPDLYARILAFPIDEGTPDLSFEQRLARENAWDIGFARRVVFEYRRFVYLAMTAGHPVTPSDQVDQAWHLHLTYSRSYWERLCGAVLERPLHHGPTRGGPAEAVRFDRQYERTLESYRAAFGAEPPADIWPPAAVRFGEDLRFVRVNTARNWVIPKGAVRRAALVGAIGTAAAVCATGCNGFVNPFQLRGTEFLAFLVPFLFVALLVGLAARYVLRGPGARPDDTPELDWADAAYLAGREHRLTAAAVARLAAAGRLRVSSDGATLEPHGLPPGASNPVESAVYQSLPLNRTDRTALSATARAVESAFAERAAELEAAGHLLSPWRALFGACLSVLPLAAVFFSFGLPRFLVGGDFQLPRGYLGATLVVTGVVGVILFVTGLNRLSRRGAFALKRMRATTDRAVTTAEPDAVGQSVALYGTTALAACGAAELTALSAWYPRPTSASNGGGCGTGCGSGGGGGGGGCGGGGCGGGGCGGCGG